MKTYQGVAQEKAATYGGALDSFPSRIHVAVDEAEAPEAFTHAGKSKFNKYRAGLNASRDSEDQGRVRGT